MDEKIMEIMTKDMHIAAILVSYGSPITWVDKTDPRKQHFHFDRLPQRVYVTDGLGQPEAMEVSNLSDIVSLFFSKKIFFPPSFVDCLRSVKAYIYSE